MSAECVVLEDPAGNLSKIAIQINVLQGEVHPSQKK